MKYGAIGILLLITYEGKLGASQEYCSNMQYSYNITDAGNLVVAEEKCWPDKRKFVIQTAFFKKDEENTSLQSFSSTGSKIKELKGYTTGAFIGDSHVVLAQKNEVYIFFLPLMNKMQKLVFKDQIHHLRSLGFYFTFDPVTIGNQGYFLLYTKDGNIKTNVLVNMPENVSWVTSTGKTNALYWCSGNQEINFIQGSQYNFLQQPKRGILMAVNAINRLLYADDKCLMYSSTNKHKNPAIVIRDKHHEHILDIASLFDQKNESIIRGFIYKRDVDPYILLMTNNENLYEIPLALVIAHSSEGIKAVLINPKKQPVNPPETSRELQVPVEQRLQELTDALLNHYQDDKSEEKSNEDTTEYDVDQWFNLEDEQKADQKYPLMNSLAYKRSAPEKDEVKLEKRQKGQFINIFDGD